MGRSEGIPCFALLGLGTNWLGSAFTEKDLGVLVNTNLNMSQQCVLAANVANSILDCIRRSVASRSRQVIISPCSALTHLECWIQFWTSQCRKDMDLLEQIQQRTTKMIKGLEHLSYEEWLRAGGEKAQGDLINVSKYLKLGRVKKMERDSSQRHSNKKVFYCGGGQTLEQIAQRGCGVSILRTFIQIKKSPVDHISQITLVRMLADLIKKLSRGLDGIGVMLPPSSLRAQRNLEER
ncbi:LOW QUALITY PROTEIN: hypothetical protein QYF61_013479, partial [Mycteria americana]